MAHRKTPPKGKDNKRKPPAPSPEQQSGNDNALQQDQLRAIFKQVDHNKDGYIDSSDLGNLMQRLNIKATKSELTAMIKAAQRAPNSKAPSGHLDFDGFCDMMQRNRTRLSLTLDADIRQLFQAIDRNRDGRISMPELRESMRASTGSAELSETEIHQMFRMADSNQDGFISFDEFTQMTNQAREQQLRDKQAPKKSQQAKKPSPK